MDINELLILKIIGGIGIVHLIMALLAMLELKFIPFYTAHRKTLWLLEIWILPVIGPFLFHLAAKSGWKKIKLSFK